MFALSERVEAKRCKYLMDKFSRDVLPKFRSNQELIVKFFLPSSEFIRFERFFNYPIPDEEIRVFEQELARFGYIVRISKHSDGTDLEVKELLLNYHYTFAGIISPVEWSNRITVYAFNWLFKSLTEVVDSAGDSTSLLSFDLRLPMIHKCSDIVSWSVHEHRETIFKRPVFWVNKLTCYNMRFRTWHCMSLVVTYKTPDEIVKAREFSNAILFSSVAYIKRVANHNSLMWTKLPKDVVRVIVQFLIGSTAPRKIQPLFRLPFDQSIPTVHQS